VQVCSALAMAIGWSGLCDPHRSMVHKSRGAAHGVRRPAGVFG